MVSQNPEIRKVLLFDLDWTLVYTGGAGVRALNAAFEELFTISNAMDKITPDGKTDPAICRELIRYHLTREPLAGEIQKLCRGYLDRLVLEIPKSDGYRVMPGIPELLEKLVKKTSVMLGLGTGNLEEGAHVKLAPAGFMKYFKFGGFGSDAEERPMLLKAGVKRGEKIAGKRFAARDVVVIGDNKRDVQAGKAIGAVTIAVASGPMNYKELSETGPDYVFEDLTDTEAVLEALFS